MTDNQSTHLERVAIKGFKSIKEMDLEMKPINIVIGANGSGKSNFISLFTFLRTLSEGKLQPYIEKMALLMLFFILVLRLRRKLR
jgi:predicted ATPase